MADKKIRDYEVSIWSLQDEFITVLKAAHLENKGMISDPSMKLSTDGMQELSFSIPMYLYEGARRIENPIWYNTRNGNLIINMRKIKVIFNKATEDEKVFDFMITKVTDRHEGDQLYCDVDCEGLAFHELGKIGYKISLSSENFYDEDYEWFVNSSGDKGDEPCATMDYWLQKFLPRLSDLKGRRDANTWYYKVEMDWSMYAETSKEKRENDKVYEEPYVSAWTDDLAPKTVQSYKEKERMVDLEESNVYNLTQNIAEKFGVFCRYEYGYDDNYHIISRTIIFYNNFIQEKQGYISLTYPYGTDSIKREIDSSDLTTKMYVKPANNDNAASGWSTIMNVDANKSLEDYVLNFDYCHETGAITAEQYAEIKAYEARVRELNQQLIQIEQEIESLEQKLPDVEAAVTLSTNAIQLDKERLTASTALYEKLDRADGVIDGYIEVGASNPVTIVLMQDSSRTDNAYYLNIKEQGVNYGSLTIYKTIDYTETDASQRLKDPVLTGQPVYDDFGNLTKITNIFAASWPSKVVYLTYLYSPKTYYERVKQVWETRLAKDEAALKEAQKKLKTINEALDGQTNDETGEVIKEGARSKQKSLIERLQKERDDFARMMGPAIREGYWQPDDFNDYGDNYQDAYLFLTDGTKVPGNSNISTLMWDKNAFDEEQKSYYELGADQIQHAYPYVELTWEQAALLQEDLSTISLMFYQKTAALIAEAQAKENETDSDTTIKRVEQKPLSEVAKKPNNYRCFSLGSQMQLAFKLVTEKDRNGKIISQKVVPILLITGAESLSTDEVVWMMDSQSQACLGTLTYELKKDAKGNDYADIISHPIIENLTWGEYKVIPEVKDASGTVIKEQDCTVTPITLVYPRIQINSLFLKTGSDFLTVKCNAVALENYEDYSVVMERGQYYITLKPEVFIANINAENVQRFAIQTKFSLSNADTSIYLDALQVIKENSRPQVSYDVKPCAINADFIYNDYNKLARIVNINDVDLKFDGVQGYISELDLDLDEPWEDSITIKNYKTKFEDLFSSIVAQTEAMKKSEYTIGLAGSLFMSNGQLSGEVVQNSLKRVDLNYAFNNGKLTIDEKNGIIGLSDGGVVAMRGGGIFTATEKDPEGNWIWNTGIVPQGINADLITSGQIDTNRIKIYAGDRAQFQFNEKGIYAYKTYMQDLTVDDEEMLTASRLSDDGRDLAQYLVMNSEGLFLRVEPGALLLNSEHTAYVPATKRFDRVAITWDGLTLRNANNKRTLYTDAEKGELFLAGSVWASGFKIYDTALTTTNGGTFAGSINDYVTAKLSTELMDDHVKPGETLKNLFSDALEVIDAGLTGSSFDEKFAKRENGEIVKDEKGNIIYTLNSGDYFKQLSQLVKPIDIDVDLSEAQATVFERSTAPESFKPGDIWYDTSNNDKQVYLATAYSEDVDNSINTHAGWTHIVDGTKITGASLTVNAETGEVAVLAKKKMQLKTNGLIELSGNDVYITGNKSVNIGSKWINLAGINGGIKIFNENIETSDNTGKELQARNQVIALNKDGIKMSAATIQLRASKGDTTSTAAIELDPNTGIALVGKSINLGTLGRDNEVTSNITLDSASGIKLGAQEGITFYSTDDLEEDDKVAAVSITNNQLLFGVRSEDSDVIIDMRPDHLLFAINSDYKNYTTAASYNGNGVLITKDLIRLAAIDEGNNTAGLVSISPTKIDIGTVQSSGDSGSFIRLSQSEIKVGASTSIYVNAGNIGLDTTKGGHVLTDGEKTELEKLRKKASLTIDEKKRLDILAANENTESGVGFRLGPAGDAALMFENGNLTIKGKITATSLEVGSETITDGSTTFANYITKQASGAINTALGENGTIATALSNSLSNYYTSEYIKNNYSTSNDISNNYYNKNSADDKDVIKQLARQEINTDVVTFTSQPSSYKAGDIWYDGNLIKKAIRKNNTFNANDWEIIDVANKQQTFTEEPMIFEQGNLWYKTESNTIAVYTANQDSGWQLVNVAFYAANQPSLPHNKDDLWYNADNNKLYKATSNYDPDNEDTKNEWQEQTITFSTSATNANTGEYYYKDKLYKCIKKIESNPWTKIRNESNKTYTITRTTDTEADDSALIEELNATFIEGDMLYIIYEDKVVSIKRYTNNDWQDVSQTAAEGIITYSGDTLPADTQFMAGAIWYKGGTIYQATKAWDEEYNDTTWTSYWQEITVLKGQKTFTSQPNVGEYQEGDIWYQISDDSNLTIWKAVKTTATTKNMVKNDFEEVKIPTAAGAVTFIINDTPTENKGKVTYDTSNVKDYHKGDLLYRKELDGSYTILQARNDGEIYDDNNWEIKVDLPIYTGRKVFYDSEEPQNAVEGDIWYKPIAQVPGYQQYIYTTVPIEIKSEEPTEYIKNWKNILNDGCVVQLSRNGRDRADDSLWIQGSYQFPTMQAGIYNVINNIGTSTAPDDNDISLAHTYTQNNAYKYTRLYGTYNVILTNDMTDEVLLEQAQVGDYWIPQDYVVTSNDSRLRTKLYYLQSIDPIYKITSSKVSGWYEYTPPRIKGSKLSVDSDNGIIALSATDQVDIIASRQPLLSDTDLITTGGIINIKGTRINIEASSELRLGYTNNLISDDESSLQSSVILNADGIQMTTDSKFKIQAGNVQINANSGQNNYIKFGENAYTNTSINKYTRIDDTGLYAIMGSFDSCYVNNFPVCTTAFVNCPILYSADGSPRSIPSGYNYAILISPDDTNQTSTQGGQVYTRTYSSLQAPLTLDKNVNKISAIKHNGITIAKSFSYSFSPAPTTIIGTSVYNITSRTMTIAINVLAGENTNTGTARVTVQTLKGTTYTFPDFNISAATGIKTLTTPEISIKEDEEAFGQLIVSAIWTGSGNPGLYVLGNAAVTLKQEGSTTTTTEKKNSVLKMTLITN